MSAAKLKKAVYSSPEDMPDYNSRIQLIDRAIKNLSANDLYHIRIDVELSNTDWSTGDSYIIFDYFVLDTIKDLFTEEEKTKLGRILAHFLSLKRKRMIEENNKLKEENTDGNT